MNEFLHYQRRLIISIMVMIIIATGALLAVFPEKWTYATGLLWGGLGGLIALRMKVMAIINFANNPEKPPTKIGFQQLIVNLFFLGAVVAANNYLVIRADGSEIANVWTAFAGIFFPNVVLMVDGLLRKPPVMASANENDNEPRDQGGNQ